MKLSLDWLAPALLPLAMALAACGPGGPSDKDVLVSLTDEVVVPAYQDVARDVAKLDQDVRALCSAPGDSSLEAARASWRAARASWMRSEAMWFGPVMERRSISILDWSPTDAAGVDELLAEERAVPVEEVREALSADRRGFGAIEHILFDSDALHRLGGSGPRCAYLSALTEVASGETDAILSEWVDGTEERAPYRDFFTERSSLSILASAAVSEVVRTQFFLIRSIVDMRLASALGLRDGNQDLSALPGAAADNGLQDLRHEILGMQAVYEGSGPDGLGVSALVTPLSEETDQRLRDQLQAAIAAIDSVQGPLRAAIVERPDQVRHLHERLSEVQRTIATEVVSLLGVSVGFTDTDGDSLR